MEGLVALVLDGAGGARRLNDGELAAWTAERGPLWVQVDPVSVEGRRWLAEASGLAAGDLETLLRQPVRQTRVDTLDDGEVLVGLRVFAAETGELSGVRWMARAERVITVTTDALPALEACVARLRQGKGPKSVAELVLTALRVAAEADRRATYALDEGVTELEGAAGGNAANKLETMRDTWQRGTALRRRLATQREALMQLRQNGPAWLMEPDRDLWRDAAASNAELLSSADDALDRLRGVQEYAQNRMSTVLNDRLYLLTILSAIMMPLGFVTGLLGVNLGGIPGRDTPWAFAALCAILIILGIAEYVLLRRLHWVPSSPGKGEGILARARAAAAPPSHAHVHRILRRRTSH